jgi:hypothetical protein
MTLSRFLSTEHYMRTEPITVDIASESSFVRKANYLIRKYGFTVSGKPALAKMTDVDGWSSYNRLYNLKGRHSPIEFIRKNLKKRPWFADYEVVVFCECKARLIGHEEDGTDVRKMGLFVFDADAKGVIEEVEAAIAPLPYGLTVQTRPKSAPWKEHRYFWHSPYSIKRFTLRGIESAKRQKDRRAREIRVEGRWDAKGSGAGGYVVSGDTPRDGDEMYTYVDPDAPIPTVPHALVDWIIEQDRKNRGQSKTNGMRVKVSLPVSEAARRHILSRAKSFANLGTRPEMIELLLKHQLEDLAPKNESFDTKAALADPEWQERIHRYAYKNPTGNADLFYESVGHEISIGSPAPSSGLVLTGPTSNTLTNALLAAIKNFRRGEEIPVATVRKRLESVMDDKGISFDWRKHRTIISRARDQAGWATTGGRYAKWFHKSDTSVSTTNAVKAWNQKEIPYSNFQCPHVQGSVYRGEGGEDRGSIEE